MTIILYCREQALLIAVINLHVKHIYVSNTKKITFSNQSGYEVKINSFDYINRAIDFNYINHATDFNYI